MRTFFWTLVSISTLPGVNQAEVVVVLRIPLKVHLRIDLHEDFDCVFRDHRRCVVEGGENICTVVDNSSESALGCVEDNHVA